METSGNWAQGIYGSEAKSKGWQKSICVALWDQCPKQVVRSENFGSLLMSGPERAAQALLGSHAFLGGSSSP